MRLYVLRHGQTQLNSERRLQGHMQTELNDVGIAQAEMVASILNDNGIKFDRIYSSPLERAIRTGEIATGVSRESFVIDHNLTEIDFGINEGRKYDELQGASGNIFLSPETYLPPEGGESLESLLNRMKHFLERMRDEECEGNVLAVSHDGRHQDRGRDAEGRGRHRDGGGRQVRRSVGALREPAGEHPQRGCGEDGDHHEGRNVRQGRKRLGRLYGLNRHSLVFPARSPQYEPSYFRFESPYREVRGKSIDAHRPVGVDFME